MLEIEANVSAIQAESIVAVGAVYMHRRVKRLAESGRYDVLVAHLRAESGAPPRPVEPSAEVKPDDVCAVIVIGRAVRRIFVKLVTVVIPVPVNRRKEVEPPCFRLGLYGREEFVGMLILLVGRRAVERVAAPAFRTEACVPAYGKPFVAVAALVEGASAAVVGVQVPGLAAPVAVAARVRAAYGVAPPALCKRDACPGVGITERTALCIDLSAALRGGLRHYVHRPEQRRRAEYSPGRALDYLDALYVAKAYGQVEGVVTGLRVADVYAVEKDGNVLARAPADADVGLRTHRSALAYVHAYGVFEQVVDTLCWRGGNVLAAQHSYNSRRPAGSQRRARGGDVHFVEKDGARGVGHAQSVEVSAHTDTVGLGVSQRSHAERPYKHLAAETREKGVPAAAEMLEP